MLYYQKLNDLLDKIELEILNNNGIIYGNYVCDKLLAIYNKNIYYNKHLPVERFYDISFNNNTIDRFIKSNIIKIAFINNEDYINFYRFISDNSNYIEELNIILEITISKDEPPFKNNNYTCYGLLLSYKNNNLTYHYSSNTGTPYDTIFTVELITKNIIKEIINKTTQYIRGFHSNYEIFTDIYNMMNNGWNISNLPYTIHNNIQLQRSECCPICLESFKDANKEVAIIYDNILRQTTNNYKIHHKCLVKYLKKQKNVLYFKCPYRYKIDFNICKYLITFQ
jgi:hypothetical protein